MQVLLSIITPGMASSLILLLVKSGRLLITPSIFITSLILIAVKAGRAASYLGYAGQTMSLWATSKLLQYSFFPLNFNFYFWGKREQLDTYILLTKREGRTGRISARGLDSMDRAPIFSQYGPEQAWLIRGLLYD